MTSLPRSLPKHGPVKERWKRHQEDSLSTNIEIAVARQDPDDLGLHSVAELEAIWAKHTHCTYCGRALVDVEENGMWDRKTGKRERVIWRQCPKFPRNGWQAIFSRYGYHDSSRLDMPLLGRTWR